MQLIEVKTSKEINEFHKVPFLIYKNNKNWISHLRQDIEKVFDLEKNKIFKEGGTAIRWILKNSKGELIGRVAAFINPRVTDTTKFRTGGLGFFECIENKEAAFLLFDSCKNWLEKSGMEAMDGPINFGDRNMYWGCQVTNFEDEPVYQMNYNPPYYEKFFEDYGFGVYFNQYVFWRSVTEPAQEVFHRKYNQIKDDPDFKITDIRGMPLSKVAEDFRIVYNGAWGGHSHFKTMSPEAAQKLMNALKPIMDPEVIIFVYKNEIPLGFYVNIPELNQIFKYVNGNLNIIGKLKFLYHKWKKTPTRLLGIVFGVTKEWQGKGLEAAMIVYGEKTIGKKGQYKDTILTWVGDFNPKMIKVAENLGTTVWRSYKTFRYQFNRTLPFERAPIVSEMKENSH